MTNPAGGNVSKKPKPNWYPPWAPRFWSGMKFGDSWKLMRANRFQIHPLKYPMAAMVGCCGVVNSSLAAVQRVRFDKKIAAIDLPQPPIFIIGHWRSGTTLLHELISMDSRFAFPSNFDAFIPGHLLVSRAMFYPIVKLLMPARRPMDDMELGIASPQEDDFALCTSGAPTPYRRIAFPNRPNRDHLALNLEQAGEQVQLQLHKAMDYFLKTLTLHYDSQLVLKSPPHTGRMKQLAEWFPGAKFVHISRHPYKLVPSTMRLWRLLDQLQGFQLPKYDDTWLKNYIFECKDLMYSAYLDQRDRMPQNQLVEVSFESLVANPQQQLERIYSQLELGSFDQLQPLVDQYFDSRKDHKTNPFSINDTLKTDIDSNWRQYMEQFGYQPE